VDPTDRPDPGLGDEEFRQVEYTTLHGRVLTLGIRRLTDPAVTTAIAQLATAPPSGMHAAIGVGEVQRVLNRYANRHGYQVRTISWDHETAGLDGRDPVTFRMAGDLARRTDDEWPDIWKAYDEDRRDRILMSLHRELSGE
jgi:hypothetical protein